MHLTLADHCAAGKSLAAQGGEEPQHLFPGDHPGRLHLPTRVSQAAVAIASQEIVKAHSGPQGHAAPHPVPEGRHQDPQRPDEVGRDAEERPPLIAGRAQSRQISVLDVTDPAVDHLEGVRGGGGAKIRSLDEGDREAPLGGVPGRTSTEDATADDHEVELARGEGFQPSLHRPITSSNSLSWRSL